MSLLFDFNAAMSSSLPFSLAWKRARCLRKGHRGEKWEYIQKQTFENHPANDNDIVFSVALFRCSHCGLLGLDSGMQFRDEEFTKVMTAREKRMLDIW